LSDGRYDHFKLKYIIDFPSVNSGSMTGIFQKCIQDGELKESDEEELQREPVGVCCWLMACGGDDNSDERWAEGAVGGTACEWVQVELGWKAVSETVLRR